MHFGEINEFQGLNFETTVESNTNIAAVIGRNGAGKSRLLKAITEGRIQVFVNSVIVPQGEIRLLTINELQPSLMFSFDRLQHREQQRQAVALYISHKGHFSIDPQQSIAVINHHGMGGRHMNVSISLVAQVASRASRALNKDVNELDEADISDFFSDGALMTMGSLNVTATMQAYCDRLEQNNYHEFRNKTYQEQLPYWTPKEFLARFGPPPWEMFNDFLLTALDGRYYIKTPTLQNIATYEAKLYRTKDDLSIEPAWLSSGEKVLMWLCLSMYGSNTGLMAAPPKLLLLDEPDGALHPQMVQKLHVAIKEIANRFGSGVMFTTHSPTSIALFDTGPIWQISEDDLVEIEKDAAIGELLVGLNQVSVHYTNNKQVYVESHKDQDLYSKLFDFLRSWNKGISKHISLTFIPAAPKLSSNTVRQLLKAHLGENDINCTEAFIQALNGQGNCAQVIGAVESLTAESSLPVHGIVDWDLDNKPGLHLHVLGAGLFYNIENAILNPLTIGIYLMHNFSNNLEYNDYGLISGFDPISLYTDATCWQLIADGVMKHVLKVEILNHDLECTFLPGWRVKFDSRYAHMNGHNLEERLRSKDVYPFLNVFGKRPTLPMDVVQRGIQASQGRTMPIAFAELFLAIQNDT